jgi:hypothetical protein
MKRLDEDRSQSGHHLKKGDMRKRPSPFSGSVQFETGGLLRPGAFSLLIHIGLVIFLLLNLKHAPMKGGPIVYRVTLRPGVPLGDGKLPGGSGQGLPGSAGAGLTSPPGEKLKPTESPKPAEMKEAPKSPEKKAEKKVEKSDRGEIADSSKKKKLPTEQRIEQTAAVGLKGSTKKEEKLTDKKETNRSLQEAIEDIRKKAALDAIQRRVTQREGAKSRGEGESLSHPPGTDHLPFWEFTRIGHRIRSRYRAGWNRDRAGEWNRHGRRNGNGVWIRFWRITLGWVWSGGLEVE